MWTQERQALLADGVRQVVNEENTVQTLQNLNRLEERDKTCKLDNDRGCYGLNICVPYPQYHMLKSKPQCDGIRRWGSWQVIRS